MIKKTNISWLFYSSNKIELSNQLDNFLNNVIIENCKINPICIVSPHAWFVYSWQIAMYWYKIIQENWDNISKNFIILAPTHYYPTDKLIFSDYEYFDSPFWNIKTNKSFVNYFVGNFANFCCIDNNFFEKEHSIETQIPFLKHISKSDFTFTPIIFGCINLNIIWEILIEFFKNFNKDMFFIISSDLSHFQPNSVAQNLDKKTIEFFLNKNTENIFRNVDACWIYPWASFNFFAIKNDLKTRLLQYQNSSKTTNDFDKVVWYTSFVYTY